MVYGFNLEQALRDLSPENLNLFKRNLRLKIKSMQPEQLDAVYKRIKTIPELSDLVGQIEPIKQRKVVTEAAYTPFTPLLSQPLLGGQWNQPYPATATQPKQSLWQKITPWQEEQGQTFGSWLGQTTKGIWQGLPINPQYWALTPEQQREYTVGGFGVKQPLPQATAQPIYLAAISGQPIENYPAEWQPEIRRLRQGFTEPTPARAFTLEWGVPIALMGMGAVGLSPEVTAAKIAAQTIKQPVLRGLAKTGVKAAEILIAPAKVPAKVTPIARELALGEVGGIKLPKPLATVEDMWSMGKKPISRNVPESYLKLQEQLNDAFYGIRRMATKVSTTKPIMPGSERDVVTLLTRTPGIANAGATRYMLTIQEIKRIAPDIMAEDINTIIFANHAKEVLVEKGAKRVMAGGFKTTAELDEVLSQLKIKLGGAKFGRAEQAAQVVQRVYGQERNRLVQSGLISEELGNELAAKYPWYNPLQYIEDAEKAVTSGKSAKPFTLASSGLKRLTEKGTAKEAVAPLEVMADQLVKNEVRIHRNQLAKTIIKLAQEDENLLIKQVRKFRPVAQVEGETIFRPVRGQISGTLSFFENGKQQIFEVPDWLYREAVTLSQITQNPVSSLIGSLNGISRAAFTSFSPPFVVSNMLNDQLAAFIRGGVLPTDTGMRLIGSLRGLANDKIMQSFRLAGGYQQRFYGKNLAKEVLESGGKVIEAKSFLKKAWEAIPAAGEWGEQATRMAGFQKELSKTLPTWRSMAVEDIAATTQARVAAAKSVELTINFGRGGYLVKSANPFVIFLNANMEAMKLPFRSLRDIPAAKWRIAGLGVGFAGLTGYNLSYPEYFDVPNSIRWGSAVVMLPSKEKDERGNPKPNYVIIIPRTREWSIFFGSITYAMEKMYSDNPTDFGRFSAVMAPMLLPVGTAAIPAPQILEELYEQKSNWDFYRSDAIVPEEMQGLPNEQQVQPWSSRTMQEVGKATNTSPLRLEHALTGLLGGAGRSITSVTDFIANLISPIKPDPKIVELATRYKEITTTTDRNRFLIKLSTQDKDAMFAYMRQPEKQIPIVTPILKRVMPGQGGQLYKTGLEQAEKLTGISVKQTREAYQTLLKVSNIYQDKQVTFDEAFTSGRITGSDWRDLRKELGSRYQGALDILGIQLPNAAQIQQNPQLAQQYYDAINTLAGTLPDKREKVEVLASGWYAIDLQELSPGREDWDTFYAMRDTYKQSLSPEDRNLLEDYLASRRTPVEQQYAIAQEILRPYWDIEKQVWAQYPAQLKQISDYILTLEKTDSVAAKRALLKYPVDTRVAILRARKMVALYRRRLKLQNPDIANALATFYSY